MAVWGARRQDEGGHEVPGPIFGGCGRRVNEVRSGEVNAEQEAGRSWGRGREGGRSSGSGLEGAGSHCPRRVCGPGKVVSVADERPGQALWAVEGDILSVNFALSRTLANHEGQHQGGP